MEVKHHKHSYREHKQQQDLLVTLEGSTKPPEEHRGWLQEMLARAKLTKELDALLNFPFGHHQRPSLGDSPYSSLAVKIPSPPSLGSAICMFWSRKQARVCFCCYVKVARCHLCWPLQAVLGISMGDPASSLCFEELPVYGMERAQGQQRCPKLAKEEAICLPATFTLQRQQTGWLLRTELCSHTQQEANATQAKIYTRKLGTERLKCLKIASSTPWVGTGASLSLGTAYRGHLQINGNENGKAMVFTAPRARPYLP